MSAARLPPDEARRLKALHALEILDTEPEVAFDDLTQMAARICKVPIALLTFVDRKRQWFKSQVGLKVKETPRASAFCAHAILRKSPLVVPDARKDRRFVDNPLVTGDPRIRFYAGVPLITSGGAALGTLCVIDRKPRKLTREQSQALHVLARFVITELELRRLNRNLEARVGERTAALRATANALRRAKQQRDLALDAAGVGLWEGDPATGVTRFDDNLRKMFGLAEGVHEVDADGLRAAVHPADRDRVVEALRRTMKGESDYDIEHRIVRADGQERWTVAKGRAQRNRRGRTVRLHGAQFDITVHKEAERAARKELKARAELATVLERVSDAVIGLDRRWNFVYVNGKAGELFDRDPRELVGKHFWTEFPESNGASYKEAYQRALDTQQPEVLEYHYEPWDRWFENRIYPAPEGISVYLQDITHRKQAEAALRASERNFRQMFEHGLDGILVMDGQGGLLDANRAACELFGYPHDELVARSAADLVVPAEVSRIAPEIARLAAGGAIRSEWCARRRGGEEFPCEVVAWQLPDGRLQAIVRDVTERNRAQDALRESARRMQALARRLAEAQDAEQRRLSAELHDRIGQNLTALGLNLSLLDSAAEPGLPAASRSRLRDSQDLVTGTMAAVRDLIAELRPAVLDEYGLQPALRWLAEQHQRRTGVTVRVEGEEPAPRLPAPVEMAMFRVAQEALTNVAKHAEAGSIVLELHRQGGRTLLDIKDDGAGFDPAAQATAAPGGHWGLEMMRERAEAAGASFEVSSAPGRGTRIRVGFGKWRWASASCWPMTTRSCATACGPCSRTSRISRWWGRWPTAARRWPRRCGCNPTWW